MKTKFQFLIRTACPWLGIAICAGAVQLIATYAQAQNLFMSDYDTHNIYEFTPGGVQSTFATGLTVPHGLAFNSAGDMFVADGNGLGGGNIYQYAPGGARSTFATGLSIPEGLAFNTAGNLFVADGYTGIVYEYTPGGARSTFGTVPNGDLPLAFNNAGTLFVADSVSSDI